MTSMLISRAKGERISQVGLWGLFSSRVGRIPVEDSLSGSELGEKEWNQTF